MTYEEAQIWNKGFKEAFKAVANMGYIAAQSASG